MVLDKLLMVCSETMSIHILNLIQFWTYNAECHLNLRMNNNSWIPKVIQHCDKCLKDINNISDQRKAELQSVSAFIRAKKDLGLPIKVIVICTHNSRRSHFGQIWLKVAANYYDVEIETYSGGTEATAFHPNAVASVERCGFDVNADENEVNPNYAISYSENEPPIQCYSKRFDHTDNPSETFGAILVCNDAAEACPFVPGADERFVLPYNDPKEFDGSSIRKEKYDERCLQIGAEMFYIISQV